MHKIVQEIIQLTKNDPSVIAVAFFGSYARGELHRDIDICIFLKEKKYTHYQLSKKRLQYASENEFFDVQIFQGLPLYIQQNIFKDLKIIYCKDQDALYDLYFKTERDFEHFRPIYEGYLEAVANG